MKENDLILPLQRIPSAEEVFKALGIRTGGLAAQLFGRVHQQLFAWSTDLREQYDRYYCVEYPTLAAYLDMAHDIHLESDDLAKRYVFKVQSPGGVLDEAYDDNVLDAVLGCIRTLELAHED